MAGKGVKLETAYIELQLDDSKIDGQIKDSLDKAGTRAQDAGRKMGKGLSDGVRDGLRDVGGHVRDAMSKAGTEAKGAGQKAGKSMSEGIRDGVKGAGGYLRDVFSSDDNAAREAGVKAGKAAAQGAKDGAKDSGFGTELGKWIGKEIGDALSGTDFGKSLRGVAGQLSPLSDTTHAIGENLRGAKDHLDGFANSGKGLDGLNNKLEHTGGLVQTIVGTFTELIGLNNQLRDSFGWYKDLDDTFQNNNLNKFFQGRLQMPALPQPPQYGAGFSNVPGCTGLPSMLQNLQNPGGSGRSGAGGGIPSFAPPLDVPGGGGGGASLGTLGSSWRDGIIGPGTGSPVAPGGGAPGAPSGFRANTGATGVVPAGAYNGPDASGGFPGWVNSIGQRFGLSPSTYGGHQTTDRHEAGFAPNPGHSNRGVDWGGPGTSTSAKQRLADFAQQHPELFEQVIWQNPDTGQTVTIAGGKLVPASYYANDLGGHRDHVHTRFSQGFSLDQMPSFDKGTNGPLPEDTLAQLHKGEIVVPKDQVDAAADGQQDPQAPEGGPERTEGYMPAAAASNAGGVAGTSSLAMLFNLGNQAAAGAIDTGASAAQMALSAMSFGAGGAAGGVGIQMAATEAKRAVSYGFQVGSILTDAAIEQIMPFGAPRWLGYDYTQFAPQLGISQIGTTTAEKAVDAQLQQAGVEDAPKGLDAAGMASQQPGGPVNAGALPGSQPVGQPVPKYGEQPAAQAPAPTIGTGPTPGGGTQTPTGPPSGAAASPPTGAPPVMGPPVPAPKPASDPLSSLIPLDFGGGLFDEGGEWKNNTWGLNTSGRSELVLTGAQADAMSAQPAKRSSDGDTYYISGMDADDVMKQVDKKKRLAAMRYTGRF